MITQRARQELPGQLNGLTADERIPNFNCRVSEVTVMNLQPDKKATQILTGDKTAKGLRFSTFHHSAPNLSEMLTEEETTMHVEVIKERAPSPKAFYNTEAQTMENLALKRPVKLAPLEIPLEVKEAQLQKMMSFQREPQLGASKLASVGSISSEPHVKRVKNLGEVEVKNLHKIKAVEKTTLAHRDGICPASVSKPSSEVQVVLPTERNPKRPKQSTTKDSPMPCHNPVTPQTLHAPDFQDSSKVLQSPMQENGGHRFRLKQMKEQECSGKARSLKITGSGMEEGKQKMAVQRAHKTLTDATKVLENIAQKHRGREDDLDEIDKALLVRMQSSRRMAVADIIQLDED